MCVQQEKEPKRNNSCDEAEQEVCSRGVLRRLYDSEVHVFNASKIANIDRQGVGLGNEDANGKEKIK